MARDTVYDFIVIGAGAAGEAAAHEARRLGASVAGGRTRAPRWIVPVLGVHAVEGAAACGRDPPCWRRLLVAPRFQLP